MRVDPASNLGIKDQPQQHPAQSGYSKESVEHRTESKDKRGEVLIKGLTLRVDESYGYFAPFFCVCFDAFAFSLSVHAFNSARVFLVRSTFTFWSRPELGARIRRLLSRLGQAV